MQPKVYYYITRLSNDVFNLLTRLFCSLDVRFHPSSDYYRHVSTSESPPLRGRITYCLRDIFTYGGWKSPFAPTVFWP